MALCSRFIIVPCRALAERIASISGTALAASGADIVTRSASFSTTRSESDRMTLNLFDSPADLEFRQEQLGPGATVLRKFAVPEETALLSALRDVVARAPFRHMITPGGFRMSVEMTNCGSHGWVTDRTGYRYDPIDP